MATSSVAQMTDDRRKWIAGFFFFFFPLPFFSFLSCLGKVIPILMGLGSGSQTPIWPVQNYRHPASDVSTAETDTRVESSL